jgi:hypothetical protein
MALNKPIYFQAMMLVWQGLRRQHHHALQTQLRVGMAMKVKA